MASSRTFLVNASTRHAIFVNRFAGSQIKELIVELERIRGQVAQRLEGKTLSELSRARQQRILAEVDADLRAAYERIGQKLTSNMKDFAEYEAEFSARMFTNATATDFVVPAKAQLEATIFTTPLTLSEQDMTLEQALKEFSTAKRKELVNVIKDGIVTGQTGQEIVGKVSEVTDKLQKRHMQSLVRTVTNHISSSARMQTIDENSDFIESVEWVSTLDGRTTHTCQALDGKVFPKNKGPTPPMHWGCRSTVVPKVKEQYRVFDKDSRERPSVGADGPETVKGTTTYNSWLSKQPASFQDEVLGPARGKLYREGGLSVDKFVDKNYQPLTLEQLKRREPLAFDRAGLDE